MCKWNKWGKTRIDPCMRNLIKYLKREGIDTVACCCGHGKYPMSIVVYFGDRGWEIVSDVVIPRKKRFYKRDKEGHYYIPEVSTEIKSITPMLHRRRHPIRPRPRPRVRRHPIPTRRRYLRVIRARRR